MYAKRPIGINAIHEAIKSAGLKVQRKKFAQGTALFIHWHLSCIDHTNDALLNKIKPLLTEDFQAHIHSFGGWNWIIVSSKTNGEQ